MTMNVFMDLDSHLDLVNVVSINFPCTVAFACGRCRLPMVYTLTPWLFCLKLPRSSFTACGSSAWTLLDLHRSLLAIISHPLPVHHKPKDTNNTHINSMPLIVHHGQAQLNTTKSLISSYQLLIIIQRTHYLTSCFMKCKVMCSLPHPNTEDAASH